MTDTQWPLKRTSLSLGTCQINKVSHVCAVLLSMVGMFAARTLENKVTCSVTEPSQHFLLAIFQCFNRSLWQIFFVFNFCG